MNMNNGLYSYQSHLKRKRRKKRILRILLIIVVVVVLYFIFGLFRNSDTKVLSEYITPLSLTKHSVRPSANLVVYKSLKEVIGKALEGSKGTYGIAIKNLITHEEYFSNEHKIFDAGSLYKLWIMAVIYNKIQSGELREDQLLSQDIAVLNEKFNIDPELAEQTEGKITQSVGEALNQMITISHNYSALLLTEKIKLSTVATFLKTSGFNESKVGTEGDVPTTTPFDLALFFEKLYKGELTPQEYRTKMLTLLKNQQLNDKLPKYLPQEASVAHKTGEIGWFTHDAGIVSFPKGDYILVVFSESDSPPGAEERIAEISKAVYSYFENKK